MNQADVSLLADALDEAAGALPALRAASTTAAAAFRQFDLAQANGELSVLAQNLGSLLALTDTLAAAMAGAGQQQPGRLTTREALHELGGCVEALVTARAGDDWIQVADLLQYDVPGLLDVWSELLASMRLTIHLQPQH